MKVMRQRAGEEQRATFLELFFDLVFVFAVTQLSHYLLRHLTVKGAAQTLLLLLVVWWAWIYTTWMANWFDPDSVPVRLTLLVGAFASLAMAIAIPEAFGARALPFAIGYVSLQVVRNAFIVAATRPESPLHVAFRRILAWSAWTGAIWIAGALLHDEARTMVWVVALVADYAGPFAGYWTSGLGRTATTDWELEHAHFAERFQTFIIIALGESIVMTGATAAGQHLTGDRWIAFALGFVLTAALWWLYFDEVAHRSAEDFKAAADDRGRLGRDAYTYLHIPIVAGIIVTSVALELVIAHPDEVLTTRGLAVLGIGQTGMGQRPLRVHAPGALKRRRSRALHEPQSDGRAGVRSKQVQPRVPPIPATRQSRGALGVAPAGGSPQPAEAPQPLDPGLPGLKLAPNVPRRRVSAETRSPSKVCPTATASCGC